MSFRKPSRPVIVIIASIALIGVAVCSMSHIVQRYETNQDRKKTWANFSIIYQGCVNYDDVHGHLPVDEISDSNHSSIVSWRVYALIYGAGYGSGASGESVEPLPDLSQPWQELTNHPIERAGAKVFGYNDHDPFTHIGMLRVDGSFANWQADSSKLQELPSDLILFAECHNSDIHWLEPRDIDIEVALGEQGIVGPKRISGRDPDGFFVCFADGAVWLLRQNTPANELVKFIIPELAEEFQREVTLEPYRIQL